MHTAVLKAPRLASFGRYSSSKAKELTIELVQFDIGIIALIDATSEHKKCLKRGNSERERYFQRGGLIRSRFMEFICFND